MNAQLHNNLSLLFLTRRLCDMEKCGKKRRSPGSWNPVYRGADRNRVNIYLGAELWVNICPAPLSGQNILTA